MKPLKLEQFAVGDLTPVEHEAVEAELAGSKQQREQLRSLEKSNQEILSDYPPQLLATKIQARLRIANATQDNKATSKMHRPIVWLMAPALAIGVALFAVAVPSETEPTIYEQNLGTERIKGASRLVIHRLGSEGTQALESGAQAKAGDLLQLTYFAAESFGMIVSTDGGGTITQHFPSGPAAAQLKQGNGVRLDFSYELDDAPEFERFFLITSQQPFSAGKVVDALQHQEKLWASGTIRLGNTLKISTVIVRKTREQR